MINSRRILVLIGLLFFVLTHLKAQDNLVYVTFGIPGAIAINYERNIPTGKKIDFGVRAHYGLRMAFDLPGGNRLPSSWTTYTISGIVRWNKDRIGFELNLGSTYETSNDENYGTESSHFRPYIGFRLMLYSSPLVYKFGVSYPEGLNFNLGYQF